MSGGEILPSDELFVYKPSKTVLHNAPDVVQETLRFYYRFDTDVRRRYSIIEIINSISILGTFSISNDGYQTRFFDTYASKVTTLISTEVSFQIPITYFFFYRSAIPVDTSTPMPINYDLLQRTGKINNEISSNYNRVFLAVPPHTIPGAIQPPIYHQSVRSKNIVIAQD